ncbi:Uncharacterized protein, RmlC-like cupin domain [Tistlia consotensis]|uniref:Uncharacterized protein, RmlC-like cupin domain n=1 Tax=Tistlia consotensis USBA 355 TaxID=560819 RepID=A0A1Y6CLU6_9PROT|nr:cupin domain-containing protein [Tistlia consotensis]SMF72454.1 Uncharacterized protein, RmlC-like cupin domain [Tistlia consotensis USBA 355]SNS09167.1 Uncharacterized protein, RmlC-like cupin domain [Tistlia consotensis]
MADTMNKAAATDWRAGVRVVRAGDLAAARTGPGGTGRATVFDFTGSGGRETWIGSVVLPPAVDTGLHDHGRHEVALYVVRGRTEIRWGSRLQFAADLAPGDWAYFAPGVPHQERNPSADETVEFVVARSDRERIAVARPIEPVAEPERIA